MNIEDPDITAFVIVVCPETGVVEADILYPDAIAVPYEHQSGPGDFQICTHRIFHPSLPESLPEFEAVTVNCSFTSNSESIHSVSIDKGRVIIEALSFHSRGHKRIIGNIVRSFQPGSTEKPEAGSLFEKESSRHESTFWDHYYSASLLRSRVDHFLDCSSLNNCAVGNHSEICKQELSAKVGGCDF